MPPQCTQLERLEFERALRAQLVLANQSLDGFQEVRIFEHQDLRVEDLCLGSTRVLSRVFSELVEMGFDVRDRIVQPLDLPANLVFGHHPVWHIGYTPIDDVRRADDQAPRHTDARDETGVTHA